MLRVEEERSDRLRVRDPFETEFQVNEFTWNHDARIPAEAFVFTPPRGAEKVESVGALELHPPT